MPADLLGRLDLDCLYLPFLTKVLDVLAECRKLGVDYWGIRGYSNWITQAKLYFQGRTTTGTIVTSAGPGWSAHNYGLALDVCRDKDITRAGLQPNWNTRDYDLIGECAIAHGLVWGGTWAKPDRPHIQWPGYVTRKQIEPLRDKWATYNPSLGDLERLKLIWKVIENGS